MAHIYKPKDSKNYVIKFNFRGKQYLRSLKVKNKRDAERLKSEIELAIALGTFDPNQISSADNGQSNLFEFLDDYLKYIHSRRQRYSPGTIECYERSVDYLKRHFHDVPLSSITQRKIETETLPWLESEYAPATVKHHMVNFRQIFAFAVKWELLAKNPFGGLVPKLSRKMPVFFKEDEIKNIIDYFSRPKTVRWQRLYFLLMLNTGNRKSEHLNLSWSKNVFLEEQVLKFSGKGGKERIVPLNDFSIQLLREAERRLGEDRVFWQAKTKNTINSAWDTARRQLGLKYKLHNFRSNFASWFVMKGGNPVALMEIMGWEDWQTVKVYMTLSKSFIKSQRSIVQF